MANNPYINKVVYEGSTLVDLTDATATADKILEGYTAYGADGSKLIGTAVSSSVTQDQDGYIVLPPTGNGGSSGGSSYTLLGSGEFMVNTSTTTETLVGTISCSPSAWTYAKMIYVRVRDKAGTRNGYCLGTDSFFINYYAIQDRPTGFPMAGHLCIRYRSDTGYNVTSCSNSNVYGVYGRLVTRDGNIEVYSKYNSDSIDGTYVVEVYALEWPDNVSPLVPMV